MSEILSDPATLEVLKDPWISKLVKNLKENPTEARRYDYSLKVFAKRNFAQHFVDCIEKIS